MTQLLKISTFKDISAFILETLQKNYAADIEIKYVKNADEAHQDLINEKADIVFMSYDDTLSIYFEESFKDIRAFMPIHGGILDLCGNIDLELNQVNIGIDTDSGYARALRTYLKQALNTYDYQQLKWLKAGATNIRYEKLSNQELDATLLNPPFSVMPNIKRLANLYTQMGAYQGLVGNCRQSWLTENKDRLNWFMNLYHQQLNSIQTESENTIQQLENFYQLSNEIAPKVYARLLQPDGLHFSSEFNEMALTTTENIFYNEVKVANIPKERTWVLPL